MFLAIKIQSKHVYLYTASMTEIVHVPHAYTKMIKVKYHVP